MDLRPCPLHATYQLVRNILAACVRPNAELDPAAHAVLLYDARNPEFAQGGRGDQAWQAVRGRLEEPGAPPPLHLAGPGRAPPAGRGAQLADGRLAAQVRAVTPSGVSAA